VDNLHWPTGSHAVRIRGKAATGAPTEKGLRRRAAKRAMSMETMIARLCGIPLETFDDHKEWVAATLTRAPIVNSSGATRPSGDLLSKASRPDTDSDGQ
jgi:hypothetical protein